MSIRNVIVLALSLVFLMSCGNDTSKKDGSATNTENKEAVETDPMKDLGIGPIKSITIPAEIDQELAAKGAKIFEEKCTACHKTDKNYIGPNPTGVLERRSPEWVMNMILNPEEMIIKNPIARKLLIEFNGAPMANQNLTVEEARAVIEFYRTLK